MQWIPRPIRQRLIHLSLWLLVGLVTRYGLPRSDHAVFETHPIINSELLYRIRHGKIHPRPDVARFEGSRVVFVDGRAEEYDAVIAATGYRISFPFLDPEIVATFLPPDRGEARLYLHTYLPPAFPQLVLHRPPPAQRLSLEPGRPAGPAGGQFPHWKIPAPRPHGGGHRRGSPAAPTPLREHPAPHAGGGLARVSPSDPTPVAA